MDVVGVLCAGKESMLPCSSTSAWAAVLKRK
jgi:hypothetical protein